MNTQRAGAADTQAAARFESLLEQLAGEYCARDDQDVMQDQSMALLLPMPVPVPAAAVSQARGGNPLPSGMPSPGTQGAAMLPAQLRHPAGTQRQFTLFPNGVGNLSGLAINFQLNANAVTASFQDLTASQLRALQARKPGLKIALRQQFGKKAEIEMAAAAQESDGMP